METGALENLPSWEVSFPRLRAASRVPWEGAGGGGGCKGELLGQGSLSKKVTENQALPEPSRGRFPGPSLYWVIG